MMVPVKMTSQEVIERAEEAERMNIDFDIDAEMEDSYTYILIRGNSTIVQFNASEEGLAVITMRDMGRWNTEMDFEVFLETIQKSGYEIV